MEQREAAQYIRTFRDEGYADAIEEKGVEWFFDTSFNAQHLIEMLQAVLTAQMTRAAGQLWRDEGPDKELVPASPQMPVPAMDEEPELPAFLSQPFPKLTMPVLVIWGLEDKALRPSQLEGLTRWSTT